MGAGAEGEKPRRDMCPAMVAGWRAARPGEGDHPGKKGREQEVKGRHL